MTRTRVNPFDQGTPDRTLFDRHRKLILEAEALEKDAAVAMTAAKANRAAAERYAEALRALGHTDKLPGQKALPNYAALGDGCK